jgi:TP901 family phage tail tape measure protein
MSGKLDRFSKKALQVGRETAVASAGAAFLIYESVKEASSVEGKMTLLMTQAHATLKMKQELEAGGKGMSRLGIDPTEYADALYPVQSVFHNTTKDLEAVKAAAEGAAVGHDTLANATNAMVSGFKANFKDVHSFKEEMALLDETVGAGKMHLPELTAIFHGSLMPTGSSLGMSQRSLLAAIASASQTGQEPEEYATRLRTALLKTKNLKGAALSAAEKLGFGVNTMQEDLRAPNGFNLLLQQLSAGVKRLGTNEGTSAVSQLFGGSRSAGTIFTAIKTQKADEEIFARLLEVHNHATLDKHFVETTKTMTFQFKELKSQAKEALLEIGKFFGPPVLAGLKDFAGLAQEAAGTFGELPTPIKDAAGILLVFTALMAPAAFAVAGVTAGLRLALFPLKWLVSGLGAFVSVAPAAEGLAYGLGAGMRAMILPVAVYAGLEALNRLLGGQKSVLSEVIQGYKNWKTLLSELFGGTQPGEKGIAEADKRAARNHTAAEAYRLHKEHELGNHPNAHPHGAHAWLQNWENTELEREAAKGGSQPKIEVVIHHKTDLNGRQLALELIRPLEQVQREQNNRR